MATLDVHLVTPEREIWAGDAQMVVAQGTDGAVGILPGHAPLLVRLAIGQLRIQRPDGRWETTIVDGGFLHVIQAEEATRVDVLAAHAERADQIDAAAARARAEELQRRLRDEDDAELRSELAKALARAELAT